MFIVIWVWVQFTFEIDFDRHIELVPTIKNAADLVIWLDPSSIFLQAILTVVALWLFSDGILAVVIVAFAELELYLLDDVVEQWSEGWVFDPDERGASVLCFATIV